MRLFDRLLDALQRLQSRELKSFVADAGKKRHPNQVVRLASERQDGLMRLLYNVTDGASCDEVRENLSMIPYGGRLAGATPSLESSGYCLGASTLAIPTIHAKRD